MRGLLGGSLWDGSIRRPKLHPLHSPPASTNVWSSIAPSWSLLEPFIPLRTLFAPIPSQSSSVAPAALIPCSPSLVLFYHVLGPERLGWCSSTDIEIMEADTFILEFLMCWSLHSCSMLQVVAPRVRRCGCRC